MTLLSERIKEERQRLGFGVGELAAIAGIGRGAQTNYEKGLRQPDLLYLAAIGEAGADILYIVRGVRAMSEQQLQDDLERYADAWETLELALNKVKKTLSPAKKRKAVDALFKASKAQVDQASKEKMVALILELVA